MPLKMNLKDVDFAKVAKLENIAEEQNNKEKGVQVGGDIQGGRGHRTVYYTSSLSIQGGSEQ